MPRLTLCFIGFVASLAACSGATLDGGNAADAGASSPDSSAPESSATASDAGTTVTDAGRTTGVPTCKADHECNDIATQSSLSGQCVQGRCKCNPGDMIVPGGKCRSVTGLGASCLDTTECYPGLECLPFSVHPKDGACTEQGKQCTLRCDGRNQGETCAMAFGPGVLCFAGCEGTEGICGATP